MEHYAIGFKKNPYAKKRVIEGDVVAVLDASIDRRGLKLIIPPTRAVRKNEIHEIITTEEKTAAPGETVNNISYVAFFEVQQAGVIAVGDEMEIGGKIIGRVAGFDVTHMPNHQNIVLMVDKKQTGVELDIDLEERVVFKKYTSQKS